MDPLAYPEFITRLPSSRTDIEGLRGWVLKGSDAMVVFLEADEEVVVPRHHHGEQWGVVLCGEMALTVGGRTRVYAHGDAHHIPAGVDHQATLSAGWKGLYVFPKPATS